MECAADSAAGIDGGWITHTHTLPLPSLGLYCQCVWVAVEAANVVPAARLIAVAGVVLYCRQIDPLCISALSETDRTGAPWICSVPSVIILINERWKPEWWSGYLHGGNYHMQTPLCCLDRGKSIHRQTGQYGMNPTLRLSPTTVFFLLFNGCVNLNLNLNFDIWLWILCIFIIISNK